MTGTSRQIEIEFRSRFDESKFQELESFLKKHAKDLGDDDLHTYFFLFPDKLLKVVTNTSKGTAKIVLKLNKIGRGNEFEEIEIDVEPEDVQKVVAMFVALGFLDVREFNQKRHNYRYKNTELALKRSEEWGCHLELEVVITDPNRKAEAEQQIRAVANELDVHLMTGKELTEFTKNIDSNYSKKKPTFLKNE